MKIKNTPILVEFAESNLQVPEHFNQSMMIRSSKKLNMMTLKASFTILCQYHDMLRAKWDGNNLDVREVTARNLFHIEEHNLQKSTDVKTDMLPLCNRLQSTIDIANGPMMRIAVFHLSDGDVMLIVIHHLVVDGVSWRILLEDLDKIYQTLLQGKLSVGMPKRKCSFAKYADALNTYAGSSKLLAEEPYWKEVASKIGAKTFETTGDYAIEFFQLDEETTAKLTKEGNRRFNADINAIMLTALSRAWKNVTGQDVLPLEMEGHGREQFGNEPLALERLIGWFTTIFPVALTYTDADIENQVTAIDKTLKAIPNKGFGYGVLTKIGRNTDLACHPLMTFNYLGSFDETQSDSIFQFDNTLPQGETVSRKNNFGTPMSINCAVSGNVLAGSLAFDKGVMDEEKGKALNTEFVEQLKQLANLI